MRNICIHKGLLFPGFPEEFGRCADVGRAAALYPDVNFIIYHSGYEAGTSEGAYDPANATRGVDTLIKSVETNGIDRNANVYAARPGASSCAIRPLQRTFLASS